MVMLKSFFILLSSFVVLFASLEKGDQHYNNKEYEKALTIYIQEYKNTQSKDAKYRMILTLVKLGDSFFHIQSYQNAKKYYEKGYELGSSVAQKKLSLVYEKEADLYSQGNRYEEAYNRYKKAQQLGNSAVIEKLQQTKALAEHQKNLSDDTREIFSSKSPPWTRAIGRLIVPTQKALNRKKIEKCSATLVNFENIPSSKVIITASHCLTQFNPKAGALRFLIKDQNGKVIQKYAKIVYDSGFDIENIDTKSDFAILILSSDIDQKQVQPLLVKQEGFSTLLKKDRNSFGSLGGFSSDVGDFGSNLTYDPVCALLPYNSFYAKSGCSGFKGASGGPVVVTLPSKNDTSYFVGVVSHFKNEKFQEIYFAPHHIFYKALQNGILKYNK
jgi:tetratricopeptide (TPR) repeat protein